MDYLPNEIVDHILYFTKTPLNILKKVNRYFAQNAVKIRIGNHMNFGDFKKLQTLTDLGLFDDEILTCHLDFFNFDIINTLTIKTNELINDDVLGELSNLKHFGLHNNRIVTDDGLAQLMNLQYLRLNGNTEITDNGIKNLTNLTNLDLFNLVSRGSDRNVITNEGISGLTNLTSLCLAQNDLITDKGISNLTNLTYLDISYTENITDKGIEKLIKLKKIIYCGSKVNKDAVDRLLNL